MQAPVITSELSNITPAKGSGHHYSIYIGVIIIALSCAFAGWLVRGLQVEQHETQELTVAVKTALDFARASQAKDQTIQQLSTYCAPGSGSPTPAPPLRRDQNP